MAGKKQENQEKRNENEGYLDSSTTYKYMPHAIHPSIPPSACACGTEIENDNEHVGGVGAGVGHVFVDS